MNTDVFSHPWLRGLFEDNELAELLSADASLAHMLAVEAAYSRALGSVGRIESDIAEKAANGIETAVVSMDALFAGTANDGVVVPALVKSLKAQLPSALHPAVHKGMTSQDVIDTAMVLSMKNVAGVLEHRLMNLNTALQDLDATFGSKDLMGRTRMQAALPIKVSDRLRTWQLPLVDHLTRLQQLSPRLLTLQLGAAAGDRKPWGNQSNDIAAHMAGTLGLSSADSCWHADRSAVAEFANWLSLVSGTLGKIGQDVALMAQQGIEEIKMSGGGGSSAMAHKQNPVKAELLITLSRYNATQLSGMHNALVHEQERSGAAWALEWMILPQMVLASGVGMNQAEELLRSVVSIGS